MPSLCIVVTHCSIGSHLSNSLSALEVPADSSMNGLDRPRKCYRLREHRREITIGYDCCFFR